MHVQGLPVLIMGDIKDRWEAKPPAMGDIKDRWEASPPATLLIAGDIPHSPLHGGYQGPYSQRIVVI